MNVPVHGYNQKQANLQTQALQKERQRAFQDSLDKFQRRIQRRCNEMEEEDDEGSVAGDDPLDQLITPTKLGRRVILPTDQPLDANHVLWLNHLYGAEAKYLQETQQNVLSSIMEKGEPDFDGNAFTDEERIEQLSIAHQKARMTTDLVTQASQLTLVQPNQTFLGQFFDIDYETFLEDLFKICQMPNEAEMQMLSVAFELHEFLVKRWFEKKRNQVAPFVLAKIAARNKGAPAKLVRMQRGGIRSKRQGS